MLRVTHLLNWFSLCIVILASHPSPDYDVITTDLATDNGPPPPLTTGCLNNSFTAPTWIVESFKFEEEAETSTVSFLLSSNAIHEEFECFGQIETGHNVRINGECYRKDAKHNSEAQFVFDASTRDLSIEGEWVCNDNIARVPVKFAGAGIEKLVLDCQTSLSPYIPPGPPGHDTPGCTTRSKSPSWTISGFEWRTGGGNYTWQSWTSSGTGIVGLGMVRLNITNDASQGTFSCVWHGTGQETSNVTIIEPPQGGIFPYPLDPGPAWYRCSTLSLNEKNVTHNYEVETLVRLISTEKRLIVNQTWYCDDQDAASPAKLYAVGAVELPSLKCRDRPIVEPDADDFWGPKGMPIINGSFCIGSDFGIKGDIESQYAMEPYALELPNPEASKCTVLSMDPDKQYLLWDTAWVFQSRWWYFWRDGEPKGGFQITFLSFVTERELTCEGFDSRLNPNATTFDPDYWFSCSFPVSYPAHIRSMKVNYNAFTDTVSVGFSWSCDELRPDDPIVFTAFAHGEISKPECADDSDGTTRCEFPATSHIPLPFTNITWDAS